MLRNDRHYHLSVLNNRDAKYVMWVFALGLSACVVFVGVYVGFHNVHNPFALKVNVKTSQKHLYY